MDNIFRLKIQREVELRESNYIDIEEDKDTSYIMPVLGRIGKTG